MKTAAVAAVMAAAIASEAAGQSLQRAPASAAPQTWRVLEPVSGLLAAAGGQLGFPVVVRFDLLRQAATLGGTIEIPLPTGAVARATIEWTSGGDVSQTFVAGRLDDGVQGEVSLTVVGDTLAGRIVMNGRLYVVRRAPNSTLHVVTEVDQQQFPPDAEPVSPPRTPADPPAAIPDQATQADTNQFVDLLVVYTPAARAAIGGTAGMVAEITASVNTSNVALGNAGVFHRFRLVHNTEVTYTEASPSDPRTDLNRLADNGDGFMDVVHTLRNTHGADVVSLLYVSTPCGLAFIMGPSNVNTSFQSSAFNVVHWDCANANLTLAHEVGHNMGLAHNREDSTATPAFDYAYGYRVPGVGRDVMALPCPTISCEPRKAIFSTPLRNFPATTTVAGVANSEDNARALDNTSLTVANFRQTAVCSYTLSATAGTIGPAGGTGTVGVTASASTCPWTAVSNTAFITITGGSSGTGSGTVTYSASALSSGTRTGTLTIAGQAFTLTQGPIMTLDHTTLSFGAISTGSALSFITATQTVRVSFAGATPLWVANATPTPPAWLQIAGGGGATGNGSFTVAVVSAAGLPTTGTVTATIQVVSGGVVNTPQLVTVRLTLFAATTTSTAPFGSFDTPASGTVQGSIAVTGWALDDIEVDRVEIWRDLTMGETTVPFNGPGHPGNGKVFIATALFIAGARPDVELAHGTQPFAYRAGWGYLLLTWGLWNQGNGAFTLYAFAFDKEGRAATLGTKAITASNAMAAKPFGALDTPTYGQTVTINFWNFGWALTPRPNTADGRTCTIVNGNVSVAIDSGPLIPVTYGGARTDIPTFFPGFSNASAAGGAYFVDISALANGTHSIGWFVVDNCGRADGIGSRFFTVAKSSLTAASAVSSPVVQDFSPAMPIVDSR